MSALRHALVYRFYKYVIEILYFRHCHYIITRMHAFHNNNPRIKHAHLLLSPSLLPSMRLPMAPKQLDTVHILSTAEKIPRQKELVPLSPQLKCFRPSVRLIMEHI